MSDWTVKIEHPNGRVVTPALLDNPQFLPNPNGKPELSIPISKDTAWLREEWDNAPVRAYNDGRRVPVERLVEQSLTDGHIELVAEGGVELDETVDVEIGEEFSHIAFGDIVTEHTPYGVDIDDPGEQLSEDVLLALLDDQASFEGLHDGDVTFPTAIDSEGLSSDQIGYYVEAEDADDPNAVIDTNDEFSGGEGRLLTSDVTYVEHTFSVDGEMDNPRVFVRYAHEATGSEESVSFVDVKVNGNVEESINRVDNLPETLEWHGDTVDNSTVNGSTTVRVETTQQGDKDFQLDGFGLIDAAYSYDESSFDNEVHEPSGYLDDPPEYPVSHEVHFQDVTSFFSIIAAEATIDIDDTSNQQAIAISADQGGTWTEATNTNTVSETFDDPTTTVRARLTLSNHSPQGPRDQTPRLGYTGQTVSELEIRADVDESPLTVDYSNEDSVETILNDIAGQGFIWEFTYQNDEPTISLTQPGDRVAIGTPDIVDLSVTKDTHTYQKVSVRGANRSVRDEAFSASDTFENLNRANIIPGTETVRSDTGETFDRGEDYTMAWTDGQIRRLSDSDMTQGETYRIDYDFEVRGSFALDGVEDPKELVTDLPGVVAERSAELVAQQLVQIVSEPQWSGEATIPARENLFSGIEALNLAIKDADLPDSAMPLVPSDRVDVGPQGIVYTLGSGPDIAEVISDVRSRTASISKRV